MVFLRVAYAPSGSCGFVKLSAAASVSCIVAAGGAPPPARAPALALALHIPGVAGSMATSYTVCWSGALWEGGRPDDATLLLSNELRALFPTLPDAGGALGVEATVMMLIPAAKSVIITCDTALDWQLAQKWASMLAEGGILQQYALLRRDMQLRISVGARGACIRARVTQCTGVHAAAGDGSSDAALHRLFNDVELEIAPPLDGVAPAAAAAAALGTLPRDKGMPNAVEKADTTNMHAQRAVASVGVSEDVRLTELRVALPPLDALAACAASTPAQAGLYSVHTQREWMLYPRARVARSTWDAMCVSLSPPPHQSGKMQRMLLVDARSVEPSPDIPVASDGAAGAARRGVDFCPLWLPVEVVDEVDNTSAGRPLLRNPCTPPHDCVHLSAAAVLCAWRAATGALREVQPSPAVAMQWATDLRLRAAGMWCALRADKEEDSESGRITTLLPLTCCTGEDTEGVRVSEAGDSERKAPPSTPHSADVRCAMHPLPPTFLRSLAHAFTLQIHAANGGSVDGVCVVEGAIVLLPASQLAASSTARAGQLCAATDATAVGPTASVDSGSQCAAVAGRTWDSGLRLSVCTSLPACVALEVGARRPLAPSYDAAAATQAHPAHISRKSVRQHAARTRVWAAGAWCTLTPRLVDAPDGESVDEGCKTLRTGGKVCVRVCAATAHAPWLHTALAALHMLSLHAGHVLQLPEPRSGCAPPTCQLPRFVHVPSALADAATAFAAPNSDSSNTASLQSMLLVAPAGRSTAVHSLLALLAPYSRSAPGDVGPVVLVHGRELAAQDHTSIITCLARALVACTASRRAAMLVIDDAHALFPATVDRERGDAAAAAHPAPHTPVIDAAIQLLRWGCAGQLEPVDPNQLQWAVQGDGGGGGRDDAGLTAALLTAAAAHTSSFSMFGCGSRTLPRIILTAPSADSVDARVLTCMAAAGRTRTHSLNPRVARPLLHAMLLSAAADAAAAANNSGAGSPSEAATDTSSASDVDEAAWEAAESACRQQSWRTCANIAQAVARRYTGGGVWQRPLNAWVHAFTAAMLRQPGAEAARTHAHASSSGAGSSSDGVAPRLGGLQLARRQLHELLTLPRQLAALRVSTDFPLPRGALVYGPPGCGKTALVYAAAASAGLPCLCVKGPALLGKYIGASEEAVRAEFVKAAASAPCVLFFDEFDALAPRRGSNGVTDRVVNTLLTLLDGVDGGSRARGVCVLAASSRPDMLDPALLRPGRLELHVHCNMPNADERADILRALATPLRLSPAAAAALPLIAACEECEGFTGADLSAVLTSAQLAAVHDAISAAAAAAVTNTSVAHEEGVAMIDLPHIEAALMDAKPALSAAAAARYQRLHAQFSGTGRTALDVAAAPPFGTRSAQV